MKKKQWLFTALGLALLVTIALMIVFGEANRPHFVSRAESAKTYYLESADERDKFDRVASVTLYYDGRADVPQPMISSFSFAPCKYSLVGGELLIYTEGASEAIAVFTIEDDNTLVFKSKTVPIFADIGARYVHKP